MPMPQKKAQQVLKFSRGQEQFLKNTRNGIQSSNFVTQTFKKGKL